MFRIGSLLVVPLMMFSFLSGVVQAGEGFYALNNSVRSGMLVSLTKNQEVVEPANPNNAEMLLGVAGFTESDFDVLPNQIAVQSDGVVNTIVTTMNGDIKVGDRISPSVITGLGAKNQEPGWVVGTAQEALNASSSNAVKSTVTDSTGKNHDVYVATIPVSVDVSYYNAEQQNEKKTITAPTRIQNIADSLAGRRASQFAILLSFILLMAGFIIAGIIVNAAVRNGIKSIARQPLAKQAISREIVRSVSVATGILGTSVLGAFILLRIL